MDPIFENIENSLKVSIFRNVEHSWPTHFHSNLELFIVRRGKYEVIKNGESFIVGDDSIFIVDHYDLHSYEKKSRTDDDCVVMIPSAISKGFDAEKGNKIIKTTVIRDAQLVDDILNAVDKIKIMPGGECADNDYFVKSTINYALALLFKKLEFAEPINNPQSEPDYIRRMLIYISEHFREDITANSLASQIGYSREYISRMFNKYMKESIPSYINKTRIRYIEEQKKISDKSLTQIVMDAGFNHTSSYYRFINKEN